VLAVWVFTTNCNPSYTSREPLVVPSSVAIFHSFWAESRSLMKQIADVDDLWIAAWTSCRTKSSVKLVLYFQAQGSIGILFIQVFLVESRFFFRDRPGFMDFKGDCFLDISQNWVCDAKCPGFF